MRRLQTLCPLILLAALLSSCQPSPAATPSAPAPVETGIAISTIPAPIDPAPTPAAIDRLFDRPGMAEVELLTPTENAGTHPRFEWQPVSGAARYSLLLMDSDNRVYWSWEGGETSVYLGGADQPPLPESAGPQLLRPMHWTVLAFDEEHRLIASSRFRPVAP